MYMPLCAAEHPHPGLPDKNFNIKPNSDKKGQKKVKPIVQKPEKCQTLLEVLLFVCHKETSKLQQYH